MNAPEFPVDEAARLLALQRTNLLDTPAEKRFDRITRLAASVFKVPICLISLVDSDRQWFKSKVGLDACETGRDISFCGHAILHEDILIVSDATKDERFSSNPLVTHAPHIRFYAGAPLRETSGNQSALYVSLTPWPETFQQKSSKNCANLQTWLSMKLPKKIKLDFKSSF